MRTLTQASQCYGLHPRALEHKAATQEGVMNFMLHFNSLERVGIVQNTTPEALRK